MIMVSEKIQLRKKASDSFSSDSEDEYELSNFKSFLCHPKRMLKLIIKVFGYVFLRLILFMELRKKVVCFGMFYTKKKASYVAIEVL